MLSCRAGLDVSRDLAQAIARLLLAHRILIGTRRGRRVLGCSAQAVVPLRFVRQRAAMAELARDNDVSLRTVYRYVHEALNVLAAQAPELPEVVAAAVERGEEHLLLDGTPIDTDRVHDPGRQRDRWYSGMHRRHGGLVSPTLRAGVPPGRHRCRPATAGAPPARSVGAGSHPSGRAAPTTSPPPACMPCLRSTPPPAEVFPPWPTGHAPALAPASASPSAAPAVGRSSTPAPRRGAGGTSHEVGDYVNADRAFVEHGIAHLKTAGGP